MACGHTAQGDTHHVPIPQRTSFCVSDSTSAMGVWTAMGWWHSSRRSRTTQGLPTRMPPCWLLPSEPSKQLFVKALYWFFNILCSSSFKTYISPFSFFSHCHAHFQAGGITESLEDVVPCWCRQKHDWWPQDTATALLQAQGGKTWQRAYRCHLSESSVQTKQTPFKHIGSIVWPSR